MRRQKIDYEEYARKKYFDEEREKKGTRTALIASRFVTQQPVLDVGCGDGILLEFVRKKGFESEGIELSKTATEICRKKGLRVFNDSFEDFKAKKKYGTITMLDVLEHLHKQKKVLRKCFSLLKDGGELIIALPNPRSLKALLGVVESPVKDSSHVYCPTVGEAVKWVEEAGFKIHVVKSLGRFPLSPSLSQAFLIKAKKTS